MPRARFLRFSSLVLWYRNWVRSLLERLPIPLSTLGLIALGIYVGVQTIERLQEADAAQQETRALEQRLAEAELERDRLEAFLAYVQTLAFQEVELRRSLLLKRPGERVYALSEQAGSDAGPETIEVVQPGSEAGIAAWWRFFVTREGYRR